MERENQGKASTPLCCEHTSPACPRPFLSCGVAKGEGGGGMGRHLLWGGRLYRGTTPHLTLPPQGGGGGENPRAPIHQPSNPVLGEGIVTVRKDHALNGPSSPVPYPKKRYHRQELNL